MINGFNEKKQIVRVIPIVENRTVHTRKRKYAATYFFVEILLTDFLSTANTIPICY